ncbi:hypothetical protein RhiirA4_460975 [Rhizophagus irregularis]|uniref:Uncharacterized protein n=1 Tax=Rhizophagus irregularis TaxID=588596 RepID=A0A2I1GHR3_9GLOM|nr:hypothetical protein RhiirA4_460975 [Rhizophagus irregularis]
MSNYPGQNILIEYLKERGSKSSYRGFLDFSNDFITILISPTDTCDNLNTVWFHHFLREAKSLFDQETYVVIKNKVNEEYFRYMKYQQNFWQRIIKEHKKENLAPSHLNNKTSDIKSSEKCTEKITLQVKQKGELKRERDDDDTESSSNERWKKQSQILKQNKNNLAYVQVVDNALLVASAYESLIADNIIPFIKILKTSLLSRSRMSLSSANEPVLQAIIENLLPLKYCIPELSLVINGKKLKGSGRFGYSDIFILSSEGDNNIILELKYISLVGLINSDQKNNFGANELENLDKILEKENEESVLKRSYTYWSKEEKKKNLTTIGETLNNGLNQLNLYMKTISKGKAINYSSSGVFDERVKITKSKSNKLKGFVVLVIGFHRIIWKSVNEVTTNYIYNKI